MTPTITARQREYALAYIAAEPRAVTAARLGVRISSVDNMQRRIRDRFGGDRDAIKWSVETARVTPNHGGRLSATGLRKGDPVYIVGGRFAGRRGEYAGAVNSHQVRIAIGGGTFAVRRRFVRRDA